MKNWLIFSTLLLISCVDEIQFPVPDSQGILVVDATIQTGSDTNFVQLFRSGKVGKKVFDPERNAQIVLIDDLNIRDTFQQRNDGKYFLVEGNVALVVGKSYHLEIRIEDNKNYISEKETILLCPPIDSLTFDFSIENVLVTQTQVLEKSFFNLDLQTTLPLETEKVFLRWQIEHIFAVSEFPCSPLVPPKTCYVKRDLQRNRLDLLNGSTFQPGSVIKKNIVKQEIDHAFGEVASFYVNQLSLSPRSYQYWSEVENILSAGGTIFDAPPAAITSNIRSLSDPHEQVLGLFSMADVQKKLILITRGDLQTPFDKLPLCGLPGLFPTPFNPACCQCLNLPDSDRRRPSYWP